MWVRVSGVGRLAAWEFGGISYTLHVGRTGAIGGRLVILALGPASRYRAVVLGGDAVDVVISAIVAPQEPARRAEAAECLLGLEPILVS